MNAISDIVNAFGGVRPFARALGRADSPSTIQYWKTKGFLPRSQRAAVEEALNAIGMAPRKAKRLVDQAILGVGAAQ